VNLIDDIDLVAQEVGGVIDALFELIHIVDAAVAGLVNLDNIEGAALIYGCAGVAFIAGFSINGGLAVDRLGKDAGCRGLAAAAWPAEEVGMSDAVASDGIAQGLDDVLLPHYL